MVLRQTAFTLSKNMEKLYNVEAHGAQLTPESPLDAIHCIRLATNLQHAMLERDLRSGDPCRKASSTGFRRRGYFYERKRDEYKNCVAELGKGSMLRLNSLEAYIV